MRFLSLTRGGPDGWTVYVHQELTVWSASHAWRLFRSGKSVDDVAEEYGLSRDDTEEMLRIYINRKKHAKAARSDGT
jgi:hypothetical protein